MISPYRRNNNLFIHQLWISVVDFDTVHALQMKKTCEKSTRIGKKHSNSIQLFAVVECRARKTCESYYLLVAVWLDRRQCKWIKLNAHWNQINRNSAQYTMPHLSSSLLVRLLKRTNRDDSDICMILCFFFTVLSALTLSLSRVPSTIIALAMSPHSPATTNDWKNEHFFCVFTTYSISIDVCSSIREHVLFHLCVLLPRIIIIIIRLQAALKTPDRTHTLSFSLSRTYKRTQMC